MQRNSFNLHNDSYDKQCKCMLIPEQCRRNRMWSQENKTCIQMMHSSDVSVIWILFIYYLSIQYLRGTISQITILCKECNKSNMTLHRFAVFNLPKVWEFKSSNGRVRFLVEFEICGCYLSPPPFLAWRTEVSGRKLWTRVTSTHILKNWKMMALRANW